MEAGCAKYKELDGQVDAFALAVHSGLLADKWYPLYPSGPDLLRQEDLIVDGGASRTPWRTR
jgi:hypothetical protein